MSTNSTIAVENKDGSIVGVYCHWDGYLNGNGIILLESYTTEEKVRELIMHGDMSSLEPNIYPSKGSEHSFEHKEPNVCIFYGRDRGEEWKNICPKYYKNKKEYYEKQSQQYNYKFANGKWMYKKNGGSWRNLTMKVCQGEE